MSKSNLVVSSETLTHDGIGVPVRDYSRAGSGQGLAPFIWVHGGGFVSGSLRAPESDHVARAIVERSGRPVRTASYRKAPFLPAVGIGAARPSKNQFPAAVEDIEAVIDDAIERWGDIFVGGASAGATIVSSALIRRKARGLSMPIGAALFYGVFHAELPTVDAELLERARGVKFTPQLTQRMNANYAGGLESLTDPNIFPGGQDLRGLPPTLIVNADRDTLRAMGHLYQMELESSGVDVVSKTVAESVHGFMAGRKKPGFADGIETVVNWMGRLATHRAYADSIRAASAGLDELA